MSVIRKIPYIESVLASLNATQLGALKTAINKNADGTDANYSFLEGGTNIPALTEEVTYRIECATIQLGRDKQRNGILIFTATYCVFLVYGESQKITIYNLNRSNRTYELVEEYCEIEELRRILDDVAEHGGDIWVDIMKDKMIYDEEDNEIQIGTNLLVDGNITINDSDDIKDVDGNSVVQHKLTAGQGIKIENNVISVDGFPGELETWEDIQKAVRAGIIQNYFEIGDQLLVTKGDTQIAFDIIGFDVDTPEDTNFTHSMTLQAHNVVANIQFDASELLHYVKDNALPAGTYKFTLLHGQYGGGTANDGTYVFTTTQQIPVGGGWRIDGWGYWESSYNVLNKKIKTYNANGEVIEQNISIAVYTSETATDLGTYSTRSSDLTTAELEYKNSIEKQGVGDNYYLTSGVRQWLNSNEGANSWWSKQNVFQLPNGSKGTAGFLNGIDPSFLAVVGKTTQKVISDTVWYNKGEESFADKFFLLSNKSVRFTTYADEGADYPYWTRLIPVATNSANANRIKTLNGSATYWWTRTAHRGNGIYEYDVHPTGDYNYNDAHYALGVVPACVIV